MLGYSSAQKAWADVAARDAVFDVHDWLERHRETLDLQGAWTVSWGAAEALEAWPGTPPQAHHPNRIVGRRLGAALVEWAQREVLAYANRHPDEEPPLVQDVLDRARARLLYKLPLSDGWTPPE